MDDSKSNPARVYKFLTEDLTVRAAAVIATQAVDEMRSIQNSYPVPTVAVGRAMVGALLMASHLKNGQELSVYFQGNGPLGRVFAEANFEGQVRGYSNNPQLQVPIEGEQLPVGAAIGIGLLTVTHHLPSSNEPHRGTVIIRTGEIGDDIAFYLDQSHQIPSVVALGVHVNAYGLVEAAGGILIELMPGHEEETIRMIEARVKNAPSISKRILEGATPKDLINDYLGDFKLLELDHPHEVKYHCRCTRERVLRSLMLLGLEEIDNAIAEAKPLDVSCEFCGRKYEVGDEDLQRIRADLYKVSLN
ncbi:MAG TPA: Hsp33 family molecular chaperone HslO [Bdellovibrionales bacterium]|nr:Hsp33 family molecular chaperone HslO [Bdellovibrionales bacterium]